MSGTIEVPGTITIGPAGSLSISVNPVFETPEVVINAPGTTVSGGAAPYPLASDPGQAWTLQTVGGAPAWVEYVAPPGQSTWALEDGLGVILLEDNAGKLLLEE